MAKETRHTPEPVRPGVYQVQMHGLVRRLIDTGIAAGAAAEAIARDRYLTSVGLRERPGLPPVAIVLEAA